MTNLNLDPFVEKEICDKYVVELSQGDLPKVSCSSRRKPRLINDNLCYFRFTTALCEITCIHALICLSAVYRIKTYLRSTMSQQRLNHLIYICTVSGRSWRMYGGC